MTAAERLWARTEKIPGGCWLWHGCRVQDGYGQIKSDGPKLIGVHRLAYEVTRGPIPVGFQIDHLCRVRHCVNPDHLEVVTPRENTLRGVSLSAQNARKTQCKRGHSFTPENTYVNRRGERQCRTCRARPEYRGRAA